jgi:hypothetical protein
MLSNSSYGDGRCVDLLAVRTMREAGGSVSVLNRPAQQLKADGSNVRYTWPRMWMRALRLLPGGDAA